MRSIILALAIVSLAACTSTPTVQQGAGAEVTYDGLHRVNNTRLDKVWVKPDIDLSKYDKILLESAGIQYRHPDAKSRYDRNADSFPLSEKQKASLQQAISEVFANELKKIENYEFTEEPGPGVLDVTIGLMNVTSKVPREMTSARSSTYIADLGSATLILELRDSRTEESLARVIDSKRIEPVVARESNPVTNKMEVQRYARMWATRLVNSLDELHALGCYVCSIPGDVQN